MSLETGVTKGWSLSRECQQGSFHGNQIQILPWPYHYKGWEGLGTKVK